LSTESRNLELPLLAFMALSNVFIGAFIYKLQYTCTEVSASAFFYQ
jgi:hypothetical protein